MMRTRLLLWATGLCMGAAAWGTASSAISDKWNLVATLGFWVLSAPAAFVYGYFGIGWVAEGTQN